MNIFDVIFIFPVFPAFLGLLSLLITKKNILYKVATFLLLSVNSLLLYKIYKETGNYLEFNHFYVFGGWLKNIGIEFKYNLTNGIILNFIYTVSFFHSIFFTFKKSKQDKILFFLIAIAGFSGLVLTNDIFNFYVFLEISSIGLFGIFAFNQEPRAIKSLFDYVIINIIIGLLVLFSIFLIYGETGDLNIDFIAKYILNLKKNKNTLNVSLFILTISIFLKSGIFPLHEIIYRIYKKHSIETNSFIVILSSKIYILMFYKIINIFGYKYIQNITFFSYFVEILCLVGMIFFFFQILSIKNIYNFINLFSISQVNYITLYILHSDSINAYYYVCIGIFFNGLSQMMIFLTMQHAQQNINNLNKNSIGLMLNSKFYYKIFFLIHLLNIVGFPLSASFMTKWYIFFDFINRGLTLSFIILLIYNTIFMLIVLNFLSNVLFKQELVDEKNLNNKINKTENNYKFLFLGLAISIINFISLFFIKF